MKHPTQYRLAVFSESFAFDDWNPDPHQEQLHARLSSSGSFYYGGLRRAYRRAVVLIRRGARQVKIETISAKAVVRLIAHAGSFYCSVYDDQDRRDMYR